MRLQSKAKDEFNIEPISSAQMDAWIQECVQIYKGSPSWISEEDHIDTVCFAKAVCSTDWKKSLKTIKQRRFRQKFSYRR